MERAISRFGVDCFFHFLFFFLVSKTSQMSFHPEKDILLIEFFFIVYKIHLKNHPLEAKKKKKQNERKHFM